MSGANNEHRLFPVAATCGADHHSLVSVVLLVPEYRQYDMVCRHLVLLASIARLRKVTRNRGQFPSEQAALKVLYLAVRNLEEFRGPNAGIRSSGWKQALQAFTIYFDGRIPTP